MPQLDRNQLIVLLKRLEGPDERDVLEASREIARRVQDAGISWDDLLAAPGRGIETEKAEPSSVAGEPLSAEEAADARSEIEALLALDGISDSIRGEINDLRDDLGEGRFGKADLRYVRALRARLS
ncbi:MAG: hypothetical protein IT564_05065 [Rhodospirillales bacterium]|nr:hypothetical protein [Rhodospirillales bacterium]